MTNATPLLALGLVLLVAALLGAIARRLGLPAIIAYLLVAAPAPVHAGRVRRFTSARPARERRGDLLLFEAGIELPTSAHFARRAARAAHRRASAVLTAAVVSIALSAVAVRLVPTRTA